MTIIFGLAIILSLLSYFFGTWIKKLHWYLYAIALGLSIFSFTQEITIINLGYVGFSFYVVVMFMSLLDMSKMRKKLMGNRAEYAIIGGIFVAVHGLKYFIYATEFYFFWSAPINFYFGIASFLIMLPLWVTSFMWIRKKMKGKTWKNLHKLSYLFYILVFVHLILITNQRMWFYISILVVYLIFRYVHYLEGLKKTTNKPQKALS